MKAALEAAERRATKATRRAATLIKLLSRERRLRLAAEATIESAAAIAQAARAALTDTVPPHADAIVAVATQRAVVPSEHEGENTVEKQPLRQVGNENTDQDQELLNQEAAGSQADGMEVDGEDVPAQTRRHSVRSPLGRLPVADAPAATLAGQKVTFATHISVQKGQRSQSTW